MVSNNYSVGNWGEGQATAYLEKKGYKILQKNFRYGHGEIDIIAEEHGDLVFVEVKTQRSNTMGDASTWVTTRKQKQIGRIALAYLTLNDIQNRDCRFDVVTVAYKKNKVEINHIANAFWL